MKKFGAENNVTSEQEYSGLTITELENKLITEEPESSRFKKVFLAVMRWGRLLIVLSLAVLLIYGACYIQNLKKEISELRRELDSRPDIISQVENIEQKQSVEETPPDSSQEENDDQDQTDEETDPDSQEEPPQEEVSEPDSESDSQSGGISQEENTEQDQTDEETGPDNQEKTPQ
jgi:cytoskeletal protein RodZ